MSFNLKEDVMHAVYQAEIENIRNGNRLKPLPPITVSNAQTPHYSKSNRPLKMLYISDMQPKQVYIYDISYNYNGHPLFLTYMDGKWVRQSAKYFIPIE